MQRRSIWLCAVVLVVAPRLAVAALDANELVRKVQARYDATQDFTADVTQEMTVASLGKTITAHGTVAFKKPGKMRWELNGGDPQVIVADGKTLWFYRPNERQVLKTPFDAAFHSSTPISFLTGVGKITDDFDATLAGGEQGGDQKLLHLTLVPRRAGSDVGRLQLTVLRESFDIYGAEVADPLGNVSRLRFDHLQRNVGLGDERFVFEVPPGVDVVPAPRAQ